jgi:hypothetical protein
VISFNYDCLIDEALKTHGGRRWDPDSGYGQGLLINNSDWWKQWGGGPDSSRPIRLLKLHGSVNWDWNGHVINLLRKPYDRESARQRDRAASRPQARRRGALLTHGALRAQRLRSRASYCHRHSLPAAGHLVRALFRADVDNARLKEVIVVDPEPSLADRFLRLLTKTPTRVRHWLLAEVIKPERGGLPYGVGRVDTRIAGKNRAPTGNLELLTAARERRRRASATLVPAE